jgi:hypothetical protein
LEDISCTQASLHKLSARLRQQRDPTLRVSLRDQAEFNALLAALVYDRQEEPIAMSDPRLELLDYLIPQSRSVYHPTPAKRPGARP